MSPVVCLRHMKRHNSSGQVLVMMSFQPTGKESKNEGKEESKERRKVSKNPKIKEMKEE